VLLVYSAIKKKCCVDIPVPTQVMLYKNITRDNVKSVATKVAVQINCKLGGAPWTVDIPLQVSLYCFYLNTRCH
jgi:aubergine-like protein